MFPGQTVSEHGVCGAARTTQCLKIVCVYLGWNSAFRSTDLALVLSTCVASYKFPNSCYRGSGPTSTRHSHATYTYSRQALTHIKAVRKSVPGGKACGSPCRKHCRSFFSFHLSYSVCIRRKCEFVFLQSPCHIHPPPQLCLPWLITPSQGASGTN